MSLSCMLLSRKVLALYNLLHVQEDPDLSESAPQVDLHSSIHA
jgi:hypothetical protein